MQNAYLADKLWTNENKNSFSSPSEFNWTLSL